MHIHLDVQTAYDRWAATYDTIDNPMVFAANHVLRDGLARLKGLDCLEFGCGTGRHLVAMAQAGARTVTGLDLSVQMLGIAQTRNAQVSPLAWNLFQHDMHFPPPLVGASANFILFSLTLEHIGDVSVPLAQARRLLRKNGIIRVVEIHPYMSLGGGAAHFQDGDSRVTMPTFPHQFEHWLKAIAKAGLIIEDMREWRAHDFGDDAPEKLTRRGRDWPWLVDFVLQAR